MLPRLMAEESIHEANRVAVGSGVLKRHEARALVAGWERTAHGGRSRRAVKATPEMLAAMGIAYQVVPSEIPS